MFDLCKHGARKGRGICTNSTVETKKGLYEWVLRGFIRIPPWKPRTIKLEILVKL